MDLGDWGNEYWGIGGMGEWGNGEDIPVIPGWNKAGFPCLGRDFFSYEK